MHFYDSHFFCWIWAHIFELKDTFDSLLAQVKYAISLSFQKKIPVFVPLNPYMHESFVQQQDEEMQCFLMQAVRQWVREKEVEL